MFVSVLTKCYSVRGTIVGIKWGAFCFDSEVLIVCFMSDVGTSCNYQTGEGSEYGRLG